MVYGLQARAYLERGTADNNPDAYKKAAEYARKAITTSGCTSLTQAQWEDPTTGFNSATANKSWIWGLPITSDNVSNLLNFQAHIGNEESWGYGHQVGRAIDKALYNKIDNKDFRKHSWLDPDRNFYAYKSCRPNGSAYFATLKTMSISSSVPHRAYIPTSKSAVLRIFWVHARRGDVPYRSGSYGQKQYRRRP